MIDPEQIGCIDGPPGGEHLNVQISPCGTKIWVCIDGSCVFRYRGLSTITVDDQRDHPPVLTAESFGLVGSNQRDIPSLDLEEKSTESYAVAATPNPPEEEDHRGRKATLGIPYKSGTKEYARAYYARNKDKMNERTKKWQRENRDKVNEYQKGLREETKQELRKMAALTEHKRRFEDIFSHEGLGSFGSGVTQENPEDKDDEQQ